MRDEDEADINRVVAYGHAGWDEIEPGNYEFPFALKVNYG